MRNAAHASSAPSESTKMYVGNDERGSGLAHAAEVDDHEHDDRHDVDDDAIVG